MKTNEIKLIWSAILVCALCGVSTGLLAQTTLVMTQPANGSMYSSIGAGNVILVKGIVSKPSTKVNLELLDTYTNPSAPTWKSVASTMSASTPAQASMTTPGYQWSASIPTNIMIPSSLPNGWQTDKTSSSDKAFWTPGGVLRLRASLSLSGISTTNTQAYTLDEDTQACFSNLYTSSSNWNWVNAAQSCRSLFPLLDTPNSIWPAVTLVSTQKNPFDHSGLTPKFTDFLGKPAPLSNAFSGSVSNNQQSDSQNYTDQYYQYINAPASLTLFKSLYGFSNTAIPAAGESIAAYYNLGDLGVGRRMHCKHFPTNGGNNGLACFVINYGERSAEGGFSRFNFGLQPTSALHYAVTQADSIFATVAMVYNPSIPPSGRMDFMVYNGTGSLANEARLDNVYKNTGVPNNCLSCHGGSVNTYNKNNPDLARKFKTDGASFLAFDQDARILNFSSLASYTEADLAPVLKRFNSMIYTSPSTAAGVKKHIEAMYNGVPSINNVSQVYQPNFVLSGWTNNIPSTEFAAANKLYRKVIHSHCTSCHATNVNVPLATFSELKTLSLSIDNAVCKAHTMPNAEQTARSFWNSPARAYLLNALGLRGSCEP